MSQQHYQNHRRWTPSYHFVTLPLIVALLIGSFVNLYKSVESNLYSASLICLGSVVMASLYIHCRIFALKLQSRVIRAEENFRHFVLTGKPLDTRLRLSQIIALRFAGDNQFIELTKKAVEEKLSNDEIKKFITEWKGDYHRV
jgi:hypothetical protein